MRQRLGGKRGGKETVKKGTVKKRQKAMWCYAVKVNVNILFFSFIAVHTPGKIQSLFPH